MSIKVQYENIKKKTNASTVNLVKELLKEGKSFVEVMNATGLSSFALGDYIVQAFAEENINPDPYVDKDEFSVIFSVLEELPNPFRRQVKDSCSAKGFEFPYEKINVVTGVYFRQKHFYKKEDVVEGKLKKNEVKVEKENLDYTGIKTSLDSIPMFKDAIDSLLTPHWKQFATEVFEKACPKQFFVMPATMGKSAHDIVELSYGAYSEENPAVVEKIGGKAFHSVRVYENICHLIEADRAEITDFKGVVTNYKYGNEYENWEMDMMKVAALMHDIYSGGLEDEFDRKRRYLDKYHPYYHRDALDAFKDILPANEWETFLRVVENHMWKWSPKDCDIHFFDGMEVPANEKDNFYNLYRLVKNLEISDYMAAQRDKTRGKEIMHYMQAYYRLFGTYDIPADALAKLDITDVELKKAFGHSDLQAIKDILVRIS